MAEYDILQPFYPYFDKAYSLASPYLSQLDSATAPLVTEVQSRLTDVREIVAPYVLPLFEYAQSFEDSLPTFSYPIAFVAAVAIVLHVANYNATAQLEYSTKIFTKVGWILPTKDHSCWELMDLIDLPFTCSLSLRRVSHSLRSCPRPLRHASHRRRRIFGEQEPRLLCRISSNLTCGISQYILFSKGAARAIGHTLITVGILLNLWTLKVNWQRC